MAEAAAWFQLEHLLDQGDELHAAYNELKAERNKLVISLEDETDTVSRWKSRHELLQNEYQDLDISCQKTEKKLEFAAALHAKLNEENVGFRDELAE